MTVHQKKQSVPVWAVIAFLVWLVINIRVEAGLGTSLERAIDGIVGGAVLLSAVFLAFRFFKCKGLQCDNE